MDFAIILAVTIVGCFALRNPLKALPVAFYAAAIAIDVVYVYGCLLYTSDAADE